MERRGRRRNQNVEEEQPAPRPGVEGDANGIHLLAQLLAAQQQQQAAFQRQQVEREALQAAQTAELARALRQLAEQNGMPRTNRKLTEFFGKPEDDVDDWIHSVNQEAAAGNWPDPHKLNVAKAALRGAAARWEPDPGVDADWVQWSNALAIAFRKKYTLQEWFNLVKAFVSENQRNWDERLPEAVIAINTARQSSTQRSPFEVIYGRIDKLPHESLFPWPREENVSNHGFIKRLRELRDTVRSTLLAKQKKMKVATDKKRKKAHIYSPGDLVLVSRNIARVGRTKKLLPLYIGPYQVVGRRSMVTYLVEDIPAMRKRKVWRRFTAHVSQMKRFRTPHDTEWDRDQQRKSAGDAKDRVRHLNRARKKCTDKL